MVALLIGNDKQVEGISSTLELNGFIFENGEDGSLKQLYSFSCHTITLFVF